MNLRDEIAQALEDVFAGDANGVWEEWLSEADAVVARLREVGREYEIRNDDGSIDFVLEVHLGPQDLIPEEREP